MGQLIKGDLLDVKIPVEGKVSAAHNDVGQKHHRRRQKGQKKRLFILFGGAVLQTLYQIHGFHRLFLFFLSVIKSMKKCVFLYFGIDFALAAKLPLLGYYTTIYPSGQHGPEKVIKN